ncbi:hypothetical protein M5G07_06880 [Serratia symbiotica]|nr:hypothetical protein [Serratia symbiotica]
MGRSLYLNHTPITVLPACLTVGGVLDLHGTSIAVLPVALIAYRKGYGRSGRILFAAWTGKEIRIAAGCFFDTLDAFEWGYIIQVYRQGRRRL